MTHAYKRPLYIAGAIAILLSIPLIAMQFTTEVAWSGFDFLIAAILLGATGTAIEIVLRNITSARSRFILCAVILISLALVWIELAVGLFGTPLAGH